MINYRNLNDLNLTITKSLYKIPRDISLVVGVPRSGLLPANLLALHLNLPLTDFEGLLEGRLIKSGYRGRNTDKKSLKAILDGKILIVDDSVSSGSTMEETKRRLKDTTFEGRVIFLAIFVNPDSRSIVDLYFEEIRGYRIFEWNLMHSAMATQCCFDIDGVLCEDPAKEQNDDGERYERFLKEARPLHLPSVKLGFLVTCRLEKYRRLTEKWLKKHEIHYNHLVMLDLPNKEARIAAGIHSEYKAKVYMQSKAPLFIESSLRQANEISKLSNKQVLCLETQRMVYPSSIQYPIKKILHDPNCIYRRLRLYVRWFKKFIFDIHPPTEQL